jgi:hypothetical protein
LLAGPAIDAAGVVYVGSVNFNLYAISGATGALAWSSPGVTSGQLRLDEVRNHLEVQNSPALFVELFQVGCVERRYLIR